MEEDLGIYLHFPFCVRKCRYCDFLSAPADGSVRHAYAEALAREIRAQAETAADAEVSTVFLGGGTPSYMEAGDLAAVMDALGSAFRLKADAEITMEVNPGTLDGDLLSFIRTYVNRVSMGVQSFHDGELKTLGRIHTAREAVRGISLLREAGVTNLSLDLMTGIPGQTEETLKTTLAEALAHAPEHLSVYSLIVEEGTPFFTLADEGRLALPGEEAERAMYWDTRCALAEAGYASYEISNYAREGFACRHNLRYWERKSYLGFGTGAASLRKETRWKNTPDLDFYLKNSGNPGALMRETEVLPLRARMEEFAFLGLRKTEGIREADFASAFGIPFESIYGETAEKLRRKGLLAEEDGRWSLTERGADISNTVMAEFLLDA